MMSFQAPSGWRRSTSIAWLCTLTTLRRLHFRVSKSIPGDEGISGCDAGVELLVGRADFEHAANTQARMLQPCLNGTVDVRELVKGDSADLLLGFGVGPIGDQHLAALRTQGLSRASTLESDTTERLTE